MLTVMAVLVVLALSEWSSVARGDVVSAVDR